MSLVNAYWMGTALGLCVKNHDSHELLRTTVNICSFVKCPVIYKTFVHALLSRTLCYARYLINLVNRRSSRCSSNRFSFSLIGHYCHTHLVMTSYAAFPHLWVFPRLTSRSEIFQNVGNNLVDERRRKNENVQIVSLCLDCFYISFIDLCKCSRYAPILRVEPAFHRWLLSVGTRGVQLFVYQLKFVRFSPAYTR